MPYITLLCEIHTVNIQSPHGVTLQIQSTYNLLHALPRVKFEKINLVAFMLGSNMHDWLCTKGLHVSKK